MGRHRRGPPSTGCSSTSAIPDGEQLYTGMKPTEYVDADKSEHASSVREELDVVLATKPNGSLFGSPTLQSPLKIGLWIWNAFSQGTTSFDKWMVKAFGTQPVLMSYANPDLHTTVGRNLLKKRGYFNGDISYSLVPQKNPKKMKLQYAVKMGQLWTIDTLGYVGFTPGQDSLISAHADEAMTRSGAPFLISRRSKASASASHSCFATMATSTMRREWQAIGRLGLRDRERWR